MKRLNRKGYLTIEIILGATIAFAIAFFLIEITAKMVSDTEDNYRDTIIITDSPLIISGVKESIESNESGIKSITYRDDGYTITYRDDKIGILIIDNNDGKNKIVYKEDDTIKYERELDNSLSNISVTSSVMGDVGDSSDIYIKVMGKNIFTGKDYGIIIPLENKVKVALPEVSLTLANYVTNLYINAKREQVINNEISYTYAPSVNLINDAFGGTIINSDYGNIRYYGKNPNNYIYFNCETYPSTNCETWRIVGVFEVETPDENGNYITERKVKIVRNEMIGNLAWDQDKNVNGVDNYDNDWATASLQVLLNGSYYNGNGSVTYYSGTNKLSKSKLISTVLNMNDIGIKNDNTRKLISTTKWNLGGYHTSLIYSDDIYRYERGNEVSTGRTTTEWTGKIALVYASDYGYAVDFNNCNNRLWNYSKKPNYENCYALYFDEKNPTNANFTSCVNKLTGNECFRNNYLNHVPNLYQGVWFLTPYSKRPNSSDIDKSDGIGVYGISRADNAISFVQYKDWAYGDGEVYPALYLDINTLYLNGTGSKDDPFQIDFKGW